MNIVLWGAGIRGIRIYRHAIGLGHNVIAVIDSCATEMNVDGVRLKVENPNWLNDNRAFDFILITTENYYEEISADLLKKGVDANKIRHGSYLMAIETLEYYKTTGLEEKYNPELEYIANNGKIEVFNYSFVDKYKQMKIDVFYDKTVNLYYVMHFGKKLYFKQDYDSEEKVRTYYRTLLIEQDKKSPHRYLTGTVCVEKGDTVIDAGVAEGNFALEIIDDVKHIFLVEADKSWNEALVCTFKPYAEKVTIINKFLSDRCDETNITLNKLCMQNKVDFIKMDIEGYEVAALKGGKEVLSNSNTKIAACAYHNIGDEASIRDILEECNYKVSSTKGYMVFTVMPVFPLRFVRGIILAKKNNSASNSGFLV